MGRSLTNNFGLQYAVQSSLDTLGGSPTWYEVEPNGSIVFNSPNDKVARNPISKRRSRRKGAVVDTNPAVSFEDDYTISAVLDRAPGAFFSSFVNADTVFEGVDATSSGYTVPAATAAQAAKFQWVSGGMATLVYAKGYATTANNGLKALTADLASSGTTITVSGNSAETAPTNAMVSLCGIRAEDGDLAMTVSSGVGTLTSGNNSATNNIDFTTLGLTVGQMIHVGGTTSTNQPASAASTPTYGFARVTAIAAGSLTLDKLDPGNSDPDRLRPALVAFDGTDDNAGGTNLAIDLLFGRYIRNVAVDDSDYGQSYYQFEAGYDNLYETTPPTPVASPDGFEYLTNGLTDVWGVSFGTGDKVTQSWELIGSRIETIVDNASRKTNATTPISPLLTAPFNTSTQCARLRITDIDETGLTTDFKDWSLTIDNEVSGEKVQCYEGNKYLNAGNFLVDVEATVLFTSPTVVARIRGNTEVTMEFIHENEDGALAWDLPSMTLGDGAKDFPVNESINLSLTGEAYEGDTFSQTLSLSVFPVTPTSAAA